MSKNKLLEQQLIYIPRAHCDRTVTALFCDQFKNSHHDTQEKQTKIKNKENKQIIWLKKILFLAISYVAQQIL